MPLGQEIAFASRLAAKHLNVAGVLEAFRRSVAENLRQAAQQAALGPGSPLAAAHGTKYPILQGPMTRVSDVAPFAQAVAEHGGLPFLALGLMRAPEARKLLEETRELLGERPWGVGILAFVPEELLASIQAVLAEVRPKYVLLAGGRPSQAEPLERLGIATYIHVPSPRLLELFLGEGARKFIFEGRECGGHVGPRTSFTLWQSAVDVLRDAPLDDPSQVQVVFAGGIHDALSAAMAAAMAAPLVARGMKVGVLMGTAYLFTPELVASGAAVEEFQRQAILCEETVLLESGVGHASRCAPSPYAEEFNAARRELIRSGKPSDAIRLELELLNVGRLRAASKGLLRPSDPRSASTPAELTEIDLPTQRRVGMYMLGQVAAFRKETIPLARLHADVAEGSAELLRRLSARKLPWQKPARRPKPGEPIAVVGMACMFPQADDMRQFWANIVRRVDATEEVPPERWRVDDYYSEDRFAPDRVYSRRGGFLGRIVFDPLKWRIMPASLKSIDPMQLMALEVAWRAFEDAGYTQRDFCRQRTGVIFAASGSNDRGTEYCFRTMARHYLPMVDGLSPQVREATLAGLEAKLAAWTEDSFPGILANVVASRVANRLDLCGSTYAVDAACASALAALHAAIEQLRQRTADAMLVGGVDGTNNPFCFMSFSRTQALSMRQRSTPFDDEADGIVLGEGIAAVLLKRLDDAVRDGDKIYAVIRGIGTSSDGRNRSLTAPYPPGQVLAVRRAYADAGIEPATVTLIEAHGTGTKTGDAVELTTLHEVFGEVGPRQVAIGSVKSMIGHTKTVAGLASLVKAVLAVRHRVLPPTLGIETPNRQIDFQHSPFYLNTECRPWVRPDHGPPRRAGVSSFGFGGTNFHVVVEEYAGDYHPGHEFDLSPRAAELFFWRRAGAEQLAEALRRLLAALDAHAIDRLDQLACSVFCDEQRAAGGTSRLAMVADSLPDLRRKLERAVGLLARQSEFRDPGGIYYQQGPPLDEGGVCFLYPGQGSQSVHMLRDLLLVSPWGCDLLERADRLLADELPQPLSRYIYPPSEPGRASQGGQSPFSSATQPGESGSLTTKKGTVPDRSLGTAPPSDDPMAAITDTRVAQPALGVVELFATELLRRFGLQPGMAAGHSYGEYVALAAAGALEADQLLRLSAWRGRLCAEAGSGVPGAMAMVSADGEAAKALLAELKLGVELANFNAPDQTIVAGPKPAIDEAVAALRGRGMRARVIPVSAAFHTSAMQPVAEAMAAHLAKTRFLPPRIPVYSNTTAGKYPQGAAAIRRLLGRHIREPVLFDEEVRRLHADGARLFVEVGPGRVLTDLVDRILGSQPHTSLSLDAADRDGVAQLAHVLSGAAALGLAVRLETWFEGRGLLMQGTAEWFRRLGQSKPKATDWYVCPYKTEPVVAPPARRPAAAQLPPSPLAGDGSGVRGQIPLAPPSVPSAPAAVAGPPSAATVPATAIPSTSAISTTPMSTNLPAHTDGRAPIPANDALARHQGLLAEWIELQKAQLRVTERFLETQDRILAGHNGLPAGRPAAPPALVPRLPGPADASAAPQAEVPAAALPMVWVAPAPLAPAGSRPPVAMPPLRAPDARASTVDVRALSPGPLWPTAGPAPPATVSPGGDGRAVAVRSVVSDAVPAPSAEIDPAAIPPTEEFRRDLLQAVSERTGYPLDMLDENLPLESGLGIDSIKAVEIFGSLKRYQSLWRREDQPQEIGEDFTRPKTLREIVAAYDEFRKRKTAALPGPEPKGRARLAGPAGSDSRGDGEAGPAVGRYAVESEEAPLAAVRSRPFPGTT